MTVAPCLQFPQPTRPCGQGRDARKEGYDRCSETSESTQSAYLSVSWQAFLINAFLIDANMHLALFSTPASVPDRNCDVGAKPVEHAYQSVGGKLAEMAHHQARHLAGCVFHDFGGLLAIELEAVNLPLQFPAQPCAWNCVATQRGTACFRLPGFSVRHCIPVIGIGNAEGRGGIQITTYPGRGKY